METPDVGDMLWAVQEVSLLIGEPRESEEFQSKFSPSVMSYVGDMIASVAEDMEEIPDDVDELDEAFDEPYFERVISDNAAQMAKQLYMIGVDPAKLAGGDLSN
jgi:hypothetical protein